MTKGEAIAAITQRLVEYYHPERIYLFGSEARGTAGPDSDTDFLVVMPDDTPREIFRDFSRPLFDVRIGADVIPWYKSDFDGRAAYVKASLPATVVREGRMLYDARSVAVG